MTVPMAQYNRVSGPAAIRFEPLDDGTDDPVLTLRVILPEGTILIMAEVAEAGDTLLARGLHIHGEGLGANDLGPGRLRMIAR